MKDEQMKTAELIERVAKDHGFTVEHMTPEKAADGMGVEHWVNCSNVAGKDIILGLYEDEELKLISFFHEVGHRLVEHEEEMWALGDNATYLVEREAWNKGIELAKSYDVEFSENARKWAKEQLDTYSDYIREYTLTHRWSGPPIRLPYVEGLSQRVVVRPGGVFEIWQGDRCLVSAEGHAMSVSSEPTLDVSGFSVKEKRRLLEDRGLKFVQCRRERGVPAQHKLLNVVEPYDLIARIWKATVHARRWQMQVGDGTIGSGTYSSLELAKDAVYECAEQIIKQWEIKIWPIR